MTEKTQPPISFGPEGLAPVVIRDAESGDVLMVAFMNEAAYFRTQSTGLVHFWSRSRNRLWQKGETSGHIQRVRDIFVNCDANSLLIDVDQVGAVCHDGYATCFYRRLEPDESLTTIRERWFDPADVYGDTETLGIATLTRQQMGAYAYLRAQDLTAVSTTSRLLRLPEGNVNARLGDELDELAGALAGTHRHIDQEADVALEAAQSLYWLLLTCVRDGVSWEALRPDRALDVAASNERMDEELLARLLRETARQWRVRHDTPDSANTPITAAGHATLHLVAQACVAVGIEPRDIVRDDLAELRRRPYLEPYFASLADART
ncbi:MAG: phosphoribosyl-AMP cyclohydrolase [Chloroflexia bacterium]|nr:phosphoribosyl-AMP cyclohydrolase [Chloroflexia bacterium]